MKKSIAVAAVVLSVAGGALAQGVQVRGVVGGGVTIGGDTITTVQYSGGYIDQADVSAGGLLAVHGGVELQFNPVVSAQALVGYHFDRVNATNGSIRFSRYPVELLGHFRVNNWLRVGGGARYIKNAEIHSSDAGQFYVANETFKPSWGSVVEAEFFPLNSFGIKVRYVSETFKSKTCLSCADLDGSHGGVYLNYYF